MTNLEIMATVIIGIIVAGSLAINHIEITSDFRFDTAHLAVWRKEEEERLNNGVRSYFINRLGIRLVEIALIWIQVFKIYFSQK
jgi:hypothetical protein